MARKYDLISEMYRRTAHAVVSDVPVSYTHLTAEKAPSDGLTITAEKTAQRKGVITWTDGIYGPNGGVQDTVKGILLLLRYDCLKLLCQRYGKAVAIPPAPYAPMFGQNPRRVQRHAAQ